MNENSMEQLETCPHFNRLQSIIAKRKAHIGVLGLGSVGLPLACAFAKAGYPTTGFEIDPRKITAIKKIELFINNIASKKPQLTSNFSRLHKQDVIIICVPTPLRKPKTPNMSYVLSAVKYIKKNIRQGQLVILESTTYPGTTREFLLKKFSKPNFKVGKDFFLAFSPERIDPGNKRYTLSNIPKIVAGITDRCRSLAMKAYKEIVNEVFPVSSVETAEMTKLVENTFRAVNIALANETAIMCNLLGVNVWEVINAAKTKPFGFMPFYPGPGIGGLSLSTAPRYLAWKIRSLGYRPRFIDLAETINTEMIKYIVNRTTRILNERGISLSHSKIIIIGVSYKKNISDIRESPAVKIIDLLSKKRAEVSYHDPYVPMISVNSSLLKSQKINGKKLNRADLVLILTDHAQIDYAQILRKSQAILDIRNALHNTNDPKIYCL